MAAMPGLPTAIADMPAWFMWASPEVLGSTLEETERAAAGAITQQRVAELKEQSVRAFVALRDAEPGSHSVQ